MWLSKLAKVLDMVPSAFAMICPCGRKLHANAISFRAGTSLEKPDNLDQSHARGRSIFCPRCGSPNTFTESGAREKSKQRYSPSSKSCSCCNRACGLVRPMLTLTAQNFPLTKYLLYCTDPAFKTPESSLCFLRKYKRNNIQLPLPRQLGSGSWDDQLDFNRGSEVKKYHTGQGTGRAENLKALIASIMPATVKENQETVVASPSKRKLSSSSPQNSPEKKVLKQEHNTESSVKMPSSVPSSPMKESSVTNLPVGSPTKKLNLQPESQVKVAPPKLQFSKLSDKAHAPTRGSQYAAGYDLKSAYEYTVPKRGSCLVKTDIQIKLPEGTYGRVAPRSGLALKNKIDVGAGVIDQDYRGNVGVILFNLGDEDFQISPGDRVAQLICEKIEYPEIEELENLDETERGEGGFGSTGVKS